MSDASPRFPVLPPRWMPIGEGPELCSAGQWWDAVRAVEVIGRRAIELLHDDGVPVGPVVLDPGGPEPRVYFLVPPGSAGGWEEPGTVPLGQKCHVVVPPSKATEPPGLHWHVPPRGPRLLTQPAPLRRALAQARQELRGAEEASESGCL